MKAFHCYYLRQILVIYSQVTNVAIAFQSLLFSSI